MLCCSGIWRIRTTILQRHRLGAWETDHGRLSHVNWSVLTDDGQRGHRMVISIIGLLRFGEVGVGLSSIV